MSNRPVVKRQYGSRKSTTSTPSAPSSSSSVLASSSSPLRSSILSTTNLEWEAALRENSRDKGKGKERERRSSTPPTSSPAISDGTKDSERTLRAKKRSPERKSQKEEPENPKKGDLRSFFTRASPPRNKKRRLSPPLSSNDNEDNEGDESSSMSRQTSSTSSTSTSTIASSLSSSSSPSSSKPLKLSQLYLDPFDTPGRSTLSCPICSLSYSRTPEDINFHAKHHKKVVSGIDWTTQAGDGAKGVTVLEDGVEWDGRDQGKVLMIDWSIAENGIKRRLHEVMETIDTELSSTPLTPEQLSESKLFIFVTPNRKVVACAVVQRIQEAYRVVTGQGEKDQDGLIQFGREEEDSGAIFCSSEPLPTLLGVHRIWTSTSSRRHGLASRLLDHMARRYLYACPIKQERRKEDVAFSQPTGKGKDLATRWTGTEAFKVFVE
ncbi:ESCO family N-acetyltransferase [Sporobolomyces salmoneus]|uniref:ESCO family N-acetyltransferase n=1 Tax=Sporobolomyces salmoneus TaxID=183962 RepID=UPI00317B5791